MADDYTTDPVGTFKQNVRARAQEMWDSNPTVRRVRAASDAAEKASTAIGAAVERTYTRAKNYLTTPSTVSTGGGKDIELPKSGVRKKASSNRAMSKGR